MYWRTRTNELAYAMSVKVVTVDSNAAVGNAVVNGSFQSNALYVSEVYGGTIGTTANLTFQTNVTYSGARVNLGLAANVTISSGNATHRVVTVNPDFTLQVSKIQLSDITEMNVASSANTQMLIYNAAESRWKNRAALISDITNLQANLDSKSNVGHAHAISDVTNLQANLNSKSNVGHTHVISDVTSLQTTLDGKSNVGHTHVISDVTNLQTTLDGKSNTGHTHTIANITSLQNTLDAKANTSSVIAIPASSARGDILFRNATEWTRLAAGTSGHVLKTKGAGADPVWEAAGAWEHIGTYTASSTAQIEVLNLDAFRVIRVTLNSLRPATDSASLQFNMRRSDTNWTNWGDVTTQVISTVDASVTAAEDSGLSLTDNVGNNATSDAPVNGQFIVTNFNVAAYAGWSGMTSWADNTGNTKGRVWMGNIRNALARNGIRIQFGSGNIASGSIIVEGIRA